MSKYRLGSIVLLVSGTDYEMISEEIPREALYVGQMGTRVAMDGYV